MGRQINWVLSQNTCRNNHHSSAFVEKGYEIKCSFGYHTHLFHTCYTVMPLMFITGCCQHLLKGLKQLMNPANTLHALINLLISARLNRVWMAIAMCSVNYLAIAQTKDSIALLKPVNIGALKKHNDFSAVAPVQTLQRETLQQLNVHSVGDAARYFSGALVKDYGGIGGLKTISVRSMGASGTGIIYDGLPVSDLQTGQIDLSRFSTTFIQSLELQQGGIQHSLLPAKAYADAATLAITTNTFSTADLHQQAWQAGLKTGSFNLWQGFAGICQPLKNNTVISVNAEALYSKGDYPVYVDNGNFSGIKRRSNSDIKSLQGEANLLKQFKDSATLQLKTGVYSAERGLPGAVIFFNDRSVQRLQNTDFFAQGRYQKKIKRTTLLASAKYNHTYTRYTDADFLNNQGGLDNRYAEQGTYMSVAASHAAGKNVLLSAASDIAFNSLTANLANFSTPRRTALWENIALAYSLSRWQLHASLLYTGIHDRVFNSASAGNKNKVTPALAISFSPAAESPLLLRVFYKASFRMPTFNDLYYKLLGSISLKPEYAKQYNAGITYSKLSGNALKKFSISADVYYNLIKDKIVAVPNQNLFVWTMVNLGKVSIRGIDINTEAKGKLSGATGWFTRIAYTWQQAQNITDSKSPVYKNRIPYTPDHSGSGLLSFDYKNWEMGYSLLFSGSRYTLGENSPYTHLSGWLTQDVFASKLIVFSQFTMRVKWELNNVFDQRFDVVRFFPMPGRSVKFSLLFNNL